MGANGTLTSLSSHAPWALQRRPWRPHEQAAQRGERQATVPDRGAAGVPASCGLHHDPTKCTELMGHATRCPHGPAAPLRRYHGEPAGEHWSLLFCEFGSGTSSPLAGSMGGFLNFFSTGCPSHLVSPHSKPRDLLMPYRERERLSQKTPNWPIESFMHKRVGHA